MSEKKYASVPISFENYLFLLKVKLNLLKTEKKRSLFYIVDTLASILKHREAWSIEGHRIVIELDKLPKDLEEALLNIFGTAKRVMG